MLYSPTHTLSLRYTVRMQNSRSLRRLAADHGALHSQDLPPNFLFSPDLPDNDDLTQLDILLAGPTHTPFAAGVFKLHLAIPPTYPQQPPTAHFRTPIFHPNVDPRTGGVCVETLKRDWDAKLTLKDILIVIQCLLIQPNPDSALNAEAGALIQDDFDSFKRRAELMTSIHAVIPKAMREAVREAQFRGQEVPEEGNAVGERATEQVAPTGPTRRRVPTARQRMAAASRTSEASPSGAMGRRRQQQQQQQPGSSDASIQQSGDEDVFGNPSYRLTAPRDEASARSMDIFEDDSMTDIDQENDESKSPEKTGTPKATRPRRPPGASVPLGELTLEDGDSTEDESDMEQEYPPSPRKSPSKSAIKRRQQHPSPDRAESSRDAARRNPNLTPPNNLTKPLAEDSPFSQAAEHPSASPQKTRVQRPQTPGSTRSTTKVGLFGFNTPRNGGGILKARSPSSSEKKLHAAQHRTDLDARLWKLCGEDIRRWNRGDFDGEPFTKKGGRW